MKQTTPCCCLSEEEIVLVHQRMSAFFESAGLPVAPPGLRDSNLLASALARPQTSAWGLKKYLPGRYLVADSSRGVAQPLHLLKDEKAPSREHIACARSLHRTVEVNLVKFRVRGWFPPDHSPISLAAETVDRTRVRYKLATYGSGSLTRSNTSLSHDPLEKIRS